MNASRGRRCSVRQCSFVSLCARISLYALSLITVTVTVRVTVIVMVTVTKKLFGHIRWREMNIQSNLFQLSLCTFKSAFNGHSVNVLVCSHCTFACVDSIVKNSVFCKLFVAMDFALFLPIEWLIKKQRRWIVNKKYRKELCIERNTAVQLYKKRIHERGVG